MPSNGSCGVRAGSIPLGQWAPGGVTGGTSNELALADFKNGVYRIAGVSKTLSAMFESNAAWGSFDPASVVNGVGLVATGSPADPGSGILIAPAATPELSSVMPLEDGFVLVIRYSLVSSGDTRASLSAAVTDLPDYTEAWQFDALYSEDGVDKTRQLYDYDGVNLTAAENGGPHTVAFRWTPTALSYSFDGGPPVTADGNPQNNSAANALVLAVGVAIVNEGDAGTATSTVESVAFYPFDANLQAASAS